MTRPFADLHVAVLMGGLSSEREVSLSSGKGCADALEGQVARVSRVDAGRDLAQVLADLKPDVVFNALHGAWGEDGCVQGMLETLGIPYTHSGVLASALAMDKEKSKAVLKAAGVVVPGGGLFDRHAVAQGHVIAPPYVIKPNAEGSSVGVYLVREGEPPCAAPGEAGWVWGEQVMVEPFIAGKELAVTVLGDKSGPRALTITDITPTKGFYDYEAKYAPGGSVHVLPAVLPPHVFERALRESELPTPLPKDRCAMLRSWPEVLSLLTAMALPMAWLVTLASAGMYWLSIRPKDRTRADEDWSIVPLTSEVWL